MRNFSTLAGLCVLVAMIVSGCANAPATTALAQSSIDCPLRDAPYSLDSPMIDILLKPEAVATLERASPGLMQRLPPQFRAPTSPSFSAIMTLRLAAGFGILRGVDTETLDADLRSLAITDADRAARCARYDDEDPRLVFPRSGVRILLFEKMTGFRDGPSVEAAHATFVSMAERHGWTLRSTERGGAINAETLSNVDVIVWNNVSGDVLTLTQRRALQDYVEGGGGFVAVHGSGGDPTYFWDWYVDQLIGARFIGHPMNPQFQDARIVVSGEASAIGRNLSPGWTMNDEWYSFAESPRGNGSTIIAELDESTYSPSGIMGQDLRMGDHPIAWTRCVGSGRAFYSAIGHRPETYADAHYVSLLEQAILWGAGRGLTQCRDNREAPR